MIDRTGKTSEAHLHWQTVTGSSRETKRLGRYLGTVAQPGSVILLQGNLGAGKTTLTQGIGVGLGVESNITSPTFTLVKEYAGRIPLFHIDLYRLDDPDDIGDLGLDEYFVRNGVCVVEWPERIERQDELSLVPWADDRLRIVLQDAGDDRRKAEFTAIGVISATTLERVMHAWTGARSRVQ